MKRGKLDGLRVRNDIRRLQAEGKQSDEICKTLNLTKDNYWYYCSQIYKEDKHQLQRERTELLSHEIMITKSRLESTIAKTTMMMDDTELSAKDRIDAGRLLKEASLDIIRLIVDGPRLLEDTTPEEKVEFDEDSVVSDAFVKFAESTTAEKFSRDNQTLEEGDPSV